MSLATAVLLEHIRCPQDSIFCGTIGKLSPDAGFFHFGPDLVCFGRSWPGFRANYAGEELYDALRDVTTGPCGLQLPFDLNEVLENLRCERYVRITAAAGTPELIKTAYYAVRPLLPIFLRKPIQRFRLRNWDKIPFPKWPVDTTVDQLLSKVLALCMKARGVDQLPFIWFWPNGASAVISLTHDVETAAGKDFCPKLMDLDSSFAMPASFQVIPEDRYKVSSAFLESIRERGFEVNVHDLNHDGHLFRDRQTYLERVDRINRYAQEFGANGFRAGALYRNLDWYDSLAFSYDMSVPNVAHLDPQRGGCCTVLPFFIGNILELPITTTQDYTLFHILRQYSIDLWKEQISSIANQHGLISFNIHPDYVIPSRARKCYIALLEFLAGLRRQQSLWIALPGDINHWWRQRGQMRLVNDQGWRIVGAGSDRARLAWAHLEDGRVSYDVSGGTS